jgi:hypothetical protein
VGKDAVLLEKVRIAIATSRELQRAAENFIAESDALLRALRELTRSPSTAAPRPEREAKVTTFHPAIENHFSAKASSGSKQPPVAPRIANNTSPASK